MSKRKWGHDELASDLANKLRADGDMMVWEDMQLGPSGSQRPDVYTIKKSYAQFAPIAYEVKVSLSDFRSDVTSGKWQGYLKYASAVTFAVPAGLITKADVPAGCGLIVRHDEVWRHAKKPTLNRVETLPHKAWMKMLIDGIDRATADRVRQRPSASEYRTVELLREKHGEEVARLVGMALRSRGAIEHEIRRHEEALARQQEMHKIERQRESERMQQRQAMLDRDQVDLARVLGLSDSATIRELSSAVASAARRLSRDDEVSRLTRCLEGVQRSLTDGLKPLPGADEPTSEYCARSQAGGDAA